jgi:SAM-dependent methyltransferase
MKPWPDNGGGLSALGKMLIHCAFSEMAQQARSYGHFMWDQRYSEPGYIYGTEPNEFLQSEFSRIPAAGKVLCLAEGQGRNAVFLATQGYSVTAVDLSTVGMQKAARLATDKHVSMTTQVADLADYDPGIATWDGIVSIAAHIPPSARKRLHQKVVRALKPNGIFILEAYTDRQLTMAGKGGPPADKKELFMSLEELQTELAGLEFLIAADTEREIFEGHGHQGMSAVVQVVARQVG